MKRRDLLAVLGGALVALRASAVESAEPVRVGFVSGGDEEGAAAFVAALRDGLAAEGYHEPHTLSLECRFHPRCPHAMPRCGVEEPLLTDVENRLVACHPYDTDEPRTPLKIAAGAAPVS